MHSKHGMGMQMYGDAPMELDQLRQLVAIEREGTITAAAASLHLTQPSLSRSMQRLEAELGCELFDHEGNRVRLNEAGRVAIEHAKDVLDAERSLREAIIDLSRRRRTFVIRSVAPAPVWRLAARLCEEEPGTIIEPFLTDSEAEVADAVAKGHADLGVVLHALMTPGLSSRPFMTETLEFLVPEGHPLAEREELSFADADGEPFLIYSQVGFWMNLHRREMPHSQVLVQEDRTVFTQLLATTDVLAFTTDASQSATIPPGRVRVPITDASARQTFFVCCREENAPILEKLA